QFAAAAYVALAPPGDAVAHPVFFRCDLARQLVLLALFFGQQRVAPFLEMRKATLQPARGAAIEPYRGAGEIGEKAPVVADDDQRGATAVELAFEPFDRRQVEMV